MAVSQCTYEEHRIQFLPLWFQYQIPLQTKIQIVLQVCMILLLDIDHTIIFDYIQSIMDHHHWSMTFQFFHTFLCCQNCIQLEKRKMQSRIIYPEKNMSVHVFVNSLKKSWNQKMLGNKVFMCALKVTKMYSRLPP